MTNAEQLHDELNRLYACEMPEIEGFEWGPRGGWFTQDQEDGDLAKYGFGKEWRSISTKFAAYIVDGAAMEFYYTQRSNTYGVRTWIGGAECLQFVPALNAYREDGKGGLTIRAAVLAAVEGHG